MIERFRVTATATFPIGVDGTKLEWDRTCQIPQFYISNEMLNLGNNDDWNVIVTKIANRIIDPAGLASVVSTNVTAIYVDG